MTCQSATDIHADKDQNTQIKHVTHLIGVHSALDGSSKESVKV
jgi:hypothetical protein